MGTLMTEQGAPVHLILGGGDLLYLVAVLILSGAVTVRGAFHELGFVLALFIGFFIDAHARLWLRTDQAAIGLVMALSAVLVTALMHREASQAAQAWARAAQMSFGLSAAVVGIVFALKGGPPAVLPPAAHLPGFLVLGCVSWGLWANRRVRCWPNPDR